MLINKEFSLSFSESTPLLPVRGRSIGIGRQIRAVATACLGALSLGLVTGYSSSALPQLRVQGTLDANQSSWYGSLVTLAAMFGGPFGGFLSDRLGRRTSLMLNAVPYTLGWLTNISTKEVYILYLGRLLTGFAVGISSQSIPIYIAEVAAPAFRGSLTSWFQACISIGIFLSYLGGLWVDYVWLSVFSAIAPTLMALLLPFAPETPRWLMAKGRRQEAYLSLLWLRNAKSECEISSEWVELDGSLDVVSRKEPFTVGDLMKPAVYKPFALGLFLMFSQKFSGINAIIFYANGILAGAGFEEKSELASMLIGALMATSTITMTFVVDKIGRRVLLIGSGIVMSISCFLFGSYYYLDPSTYSWLSLGSLCLYISAFGMGWAALPWGMAAELLPEQGYGFTSGVCTSFNWIIAFIVTKEFSDMQTNLTRSGPFWIYGLVSLFGAVGTALWIPETKNKSLKEISAYFEN